MQERIEVAVADRLIEAACFKNAGRQKELVCKLLRPLFAQIRGRDHKQAALAFGALLGQQQARLDGLSETSLVGEDCPFGERASEREESRIDLMRVQVNLSVGKDSGELFDSVG